MLQYVRTVWSYILGIYALSMNMVCKSATNIIYKKSVSNTFFNKTKQQHNKYLGLEICAIGEQPLETLLISLFKYLGLEICAIGEQPLETLLIHSFSSLSYDRSKASSKASSPHIAIQSFLFQMRVSSPFLEVIQ